MFHSHCDDYVFWNKLTTLGGEAEEKKKASREEYRVRCERSLDLQTMVCVVIGLRESEIVMVVVAMKEIIDCLVNVASKKINLKQTIGAKKLLAALTGILRFLSRDLHQTPILRDSIAFDGFI